MAKKQWNKSMCKEVVMKKTLQFLGIIGLVCLLTAGMVRICNYLLVDDTQRYTRLTMHELYETDEEIDTLFLGSSHCFRAYDPELFTKRTGKVSFNLGSSSQNYDTSYYLLKEAVRYHDIQTVYLDMHYKFLFVDKIDRDLVQANIISDYMPWSLNKLEFLTQTAERKHLTNRLLPFRRDWQKIADLPYMKDIWMKKQTDTYQNYEPIVREEEYYAGNGFVWSDAELNAEEITWWDNFTDISEDMGSNVTYTLDYIEKIAAFCEAEQIRLIFVTAPSFQRYLEEVGPYEPANSFIQDLADKYGVNYWDFNLCEERYLDLEADAFIDVDHLNGKGAQAVTELLAKLDGLAVEKDVVSWYDIR